MGKVFKENRVKLSTNFSCQASPDTVNRRFEFRKRSQLFIRTHNETLSVAMCRLSAKAIPWVRLIERMPRRQCGLPNGLMIGRSDCAQVFQVKRSNWNAFVSR